ncbi:prolyl oligopeptidase family serine peptidase [Herbiconiux sp.]|uniref:alpha/beta hydrolase family protein n=1 Tax=Herbiconiux sp. TaxID=1871186 RepID=UPI0025B92A97|nr:prolyl oligopeptidase family serine peptidase [Herbiconiux sp.]
MFEPFPGNYVWNLSVNLSLSTGGQLTEILEAIDPVIALSAKGDDATSAYLDAWEGLGDRMVSLGDEELAAGRPWSAASRFERAANYYMTGERMQEIGGRRRTEVYGKMLEAFARVVVHGGEPVSRVEIPCEGGSFPGLFFRAPGAGPRTPVMVQFNGLDSTKEQMWGSPLRTELARRGISLLMVDHPGTGEALRLRGLTAVPESERWGSACIDYLESRDDIDQARIGIVGWSLGGYYAPRAAAFEPRFALCVAWGANYHWGELQKARSRREGENPVPHYWKHVQWVWGVEDQDAFMERAAEVSLAGVVPLIAVPFLVTHGAGDRQIPLTDATEQFEAATGSPDRELKIFTERDGGIEHVSVDNMLPVSAFIADWVAARL